MDSIIEYIENNYYFLQDKEAMYSYYNELCTIAVRPITIEDLIEYVKINSTFSI